LSIRTDDRAIDLWAVGVSLYELFTGHVMFPGRSNNEMLKLMMAVKGKFSNKQVSRDVFLTLSSPLMTVSTSF
jgi:serine/threonine-protein kinase PRP4